MTEGDRLEELFYSENANESESAKENESAEEMAIAS
jgi:hypothetical protein